MINNPIVLILIKNKAAQTYYNKKGFNCDINTYLQFPVNLLKINAHNIVEVKCELCQNIQNIMYSKYNANISRHDFYSCKRCSGKKRKETCLTKYGVEHISQTDNNKNRMSLVMSSEKFKDKSKETCLTKYGVDHYSKTDDFKLQFKETMIKRYGVEYSMQSEIILNKSKETCLTKYGVENAMQSNEIFNKVKNTCLCKYGVMYSILSEEIKNKIKKTKISKGLIMDYSKFDKILYKKYSRTIYFLTKKTSIDIKNNWTGYDYYDNKYIKDNYNLKPTDKNYPTIDHKISIFSSFILNIPMSEVADAKNLCITTRSNNSKKSKLNYEEYLIILENLNS